MQVRALSHTHGHAAAAAACRYARVGAKARRKRLFLPAARGDHAGALKTAPPPPRARTELERPIDLKCCPPSLTTTSKKSDARTTAVMSSVYPCSRTTASQPSSRATCTAAHGRERVQLGITGEKTSGQRLPFWVSRD